MTIATLFREIFLRLNTLAEQLKNGLPALRNSAAGQHPEPESQNTEEDDHAFFPPETPSEISQKREERPYSEGDLTTLAERLAERLSVRHDESASGPAVGPQAALPSGDLPPETIRKIVELTAEKLAGARTGSEPIREEEDRGTAMNELSAKLDTILAAVKSNGEQLRNIAEIDTNTIFFS